MWRERLQELGERIKEADLVLVGLGEEFQYDWRALTEDVRYCDIEEEIVCSGEYNWVVPFLQKMVLEQKKEDKWRKAYEGLGRIIADKNYFVVSLCMDDYIYEGEFHRDRIVTPCGGFRKMQCDDNCSHILSEICQDSYDMVLRYYRKELALKDLREPICPQCGKKMRFNQLGVTHYAKEGYLEQWNTYTKWLQGTVNRKLCVLELGVGMEYPAVIRFPFEKIVFYNQKAFMYRIHSMLYQMGEAIGDRGIGIKADPVEFLCG